MREGLLERLPGLNLVCSVIESKVPWHVIGDDLPQRQTEVSQHVEDAKAQEFYTARERSRSG